MSHSWQTSQVKWSQSWETTAARDHLSWMTINIRHKGLQKENCHEIPPVLKDHSFSALFKAFRRPLPWATYLSWQTTIVFLFGTKGFKKTTAMRDHLSWKITSFFVTFKETTGVRDHLSSEAIIFQHKSLTFSTLDLFTGVGFFCKGPSRGYTFARQISVLTVPLLMMAIIS